MDALTGNRMPDLDRVTETIPATRQGQLDTVDAVREAAAQAGNMGLKGLFAVLGNSTAMVVVAVVLFWMIQSSNSSHAETVGILKDMLKTTTDTQSTVIRENTAAITNLAAEVRASRNERIKGLP